MNTALQDIPTDRLVPHPENSNRMTADMLTKLRRHIERTGRYEPLTVRPHPSLEGKYEVINGHNRLRVLRAIGRESARCSVWDIDDAQARLYLATLNRLAGNDVPERRAPLLESLLGAFDVAELSALLPEDREQLEELKRLAHLEPEDLVSKSASEKQESQVPVILDFILAEAEAKEVNLALDMIRASAEEGISASQALVHLACFYLIRCTPHEGAWHRGNGAFKG
jgi:ParB-like chromosome segregation protein Spo0J